MSSSSTNRTGRVSSVNYSAGTYEVTYFDRGKSVTRTINAQSNGEYNMPKVGQIVSVNHNSNGTGMGTTTGTIWNKTNSPAEGYEGLYRKEYSTYEQGVAYERYDKNTGVYTQYTPTRTGRTCKGTIYDEADGGAYFTAQGVVAILSRGSSASIQASTGVGITAGTTTTIDAGTSVSIEAGTDMSVSVGGKEILTITGTATETYTGKATRIYQGEVNEKLQANVTREVTADIEETVTGKVTKTVTGDITLTLNGASITVSTAGDVTISSPTKIDLSAPEVNIKGDSGEVEVNSIKLTQHVHSNPEGGNTGPAQ